LAETDKDTIHYFVDEAGDPSLFNRKGNIIVGNEGCSSYFIIGKLEIDEPDQLASELEVLRAELLADPYFKNVPSMQLDNRKTAIAFHANIRYRENEQYDLLVTELFRKLHHMADEVNVCFSMRGTKPRNEAFRTALEQAGEEFKRSFGFEHHGTNNIISSTPAKCAGLQAVDYYLWALQRFYERQEDRYLEMIWGQVGEIHDLDRVEDGRRGVFYSKKKPLNSAAFKS